MPWCFIMVTQGVTIKVAPNWWCDAYDANDGLLDYRLLSNDMNGCFLLFWVIQRWFVAWMDQNQKVLKPSISWMDYYIIQILKKRHRCHIRHKKIISWWWWHNILRLQLILFLTKKKKRHFRHMCHGIRW